MATLLSGFLGPFTGKVGGAVGAIWKGINYIKEYKIPANPNTAGQQAQRLKFKTVVALAQSLIPTLVTTFWNPFAVKMSGFNYLVKNIFPNMSSTGLIEPAAQMTKGTLEDLVSNTATYATATGDVVATYSSTINGNGLATDLVGILCISKIDNSILGYQASGEVRSDGSTTITIATGLTATNVIVFIWASRGTGSEFMVSNSKGDTCAAP